MKKILFVIIAFMIFRTSCSAVAQEEADVLTNIDFSVSGETGVAGLAKFWVVGSPKKYQVELLIFNGTLAQLDFTFANYSAQNKNGKTFPLQFDRIDNNDGGKSNPILQPEDTIQIFCSFPGDPIDLGISNILVELPDGNLITFKPNPRLIMPDKK